ncbi:MAG TPA: indolepyruvate oxidoreductase subunit beta [Syntrophales bacterium]|nr:indolepyruvate oxidoreductase subunit beta [Syntrophales bacterium]HQN76709.1 indolepyruvate oxidoreductase subunit beta [Syntrophales bacterium]HQQ26062.1 indolepyruvate oxidoreductase subunit beta [Syntrophales bacterium]
MESKVRSILIAGVGGQGVLKASDILSAVIIEAGMDVKKSEVHGMAQRGGCVTSHVRYGSRVYSPLARKGDVDLILSFEKLETLRYLDYLKEGGRVIINDLEVYPPSVNMGEAEYPPDVIDLVADHVDTVEVVDASEKAARLGDPRMVNTILLGVLSRHMDIDSAVWEKVLRKTFPPKVVEKNIEAFHLGRKD